MLICNADKTKLLRETSPGLSATLPRGEGRFCGRQSQAEVIGGIFWRSPRHCVPRDDTNGTVARNFSVMEQEYSRAADSRPYARTGT